MTFVRRVSSLILVFCLLLTLFGAPAFAAVKAPAIKLNRATLTLGLTEDVNTTEALIATIANNAGALDSSLIAWRSSNPLVADVDGKGAITAKAFGSAKITATLPGAKTASCVVRVKKIYVSKIGVTPATVTLLAGRAGVQLTAAITPAKADIQAVTWSSSKPLVATVDASGFVTPLKPGKTVITCRAADGSKVKRLRRVTVKPVVPESVSVDSAMTLAVNSRIALTPTVLPADATNKSVVWSSSNKKIATVTSAGVVVGVKPGTATITCKTVSGERKAKCLVTVDFSASKTHVIAIGQEAYAPGMELDGTVNDRNNFLAAYDLSTLGTKGGRAVLANLTGDQIRSQLMNAPSSMGIGENDITYFYYSGHGMDSQNIAYRGALVGVDYDGSDAWSLITVQEMRSYLDQIPGTVVVVLDCCLSGQFIEAKRSRTLQPVSDARAQAFANELISAFKTTTVAASTYAKGTSSLISTASKYKYKIMVACQPRQLSYMDDGVSSYFTDFFAEAATGTPMYGDRNGNKWLTTYEIYKYVYPKVNLRIAQLNNIYNTKIKQQIMVWPSSDAYPIFAR